MTTSIQGPPQSTSVAQARGPSPGRSRLHLPPSFERAAHNVEAEFQRVIHDPRGEAARAIHGVEHGAQRAIQGVEHGAQRAYQSFHPISGARPTTMPAHKPVFQPVPGYKPDASPKKQGIGNFIYVEPGSISIAVLVASGLMMAFACWMPFYLAVCLLWDVHYRTWVGWGLSVFVVCFSVLMPMAFVGTIYLIMQRGRGSGVRTEETMVLVGATFASLLGVTLCLTSLPMASSAAGTISRLSFGCDLADPVSAMLVYHSQVLHNIRNTPQCQTLGSIKDCDGFKANYYTNYLFKLERDFDCTGLCTLPSPPTQPPASTQTVVAPHPAAGRVPQGDGGGVTHRSFLMQLNSEQNEAWQQKRALVMTNKTMSGSRTTVFSSSQKIPALKLFSDDKTDQRCYPLIADRLQVISTTTGELLFWQGVGLLFVSVGAGATKVIDKILFENKHGHM